ncbi:MAG TPA: thioredoxin, partial [Aggregatilineales bacterium]|nr:thioredoxin [Aggregatilineales bacterium]
SGDLATAMDTNLPVLLLVWNGETLRSDVKTELDRVAKDYANRIRVVKVDTSKTPEAAAYFEVGKHPLLIAWANGESLTRRNRPWGTDVQGVVDVLVPYIPADAAPVAAPAPAPAIEKFDTKPVKVTDATFQAEVVDYSLPVLVDFWATWCAPCKQVAPILEKLAKEFSGKVRIAKVDVDENPGLAQALQIMSIPTLMFFKSGKIVGQQVGALPEAPLRKAVQQLIDIKV